MSVQMILITNCCCSEGITKWEELFSGGHRRMFAFSAASPTLIPAEISVGEAKLFNEFSNHIHSIDFLFQ